MECIELCQVDVLLKSQNNLILWSTTQENAASSLCNIITSTLAKEKKQKRKIKAMKIVLLNKQLRSQESFVFWNTWEFCWLLWGGNHINDREKLNWITKPITYLICFLRWPSTWRKGSFKLIFWSLFFLYAGNVPTNTCHVHWTDSI